ncbi:hypothetical protein BX070DRAFT_230606 [Coemansia spiralis]|nr:hypothetical protein BX070DRAFT_230606 [Coemansia spiralis]
MLRFSPTNPYSKNSIAVFFRLFFALFHVTSLSGKRVRVNQILSEWSRSANIQIFSAISCQNKVTNGFIQLFLQ